MHRAHIKMLLHCLSKIAPKAARKHDALRTAKGFSSITGSSGTWAPQADKGTTSKQR